MADPGNFAPPSGIDPSIGITHGPQPGLVMAAQGSSAAPLDDSIDGKFSAATSAGESWADGAAAWAESAQGAGSGGFSLPFGQEGTAQDWPTSPDVSHQGP